MAGSTNSCTQEMGLRFCCGPKHGKWRKAEETLSCSSRENEILVTKGFQVQLESLSSSLGLPGSQWRTGFVQRGSQEYKVSHEAVDQRPVKWFKLS